jgi:hypothetical protein
MRWQTLAGALTRREAITSRFAAVSDPRLQRRLLTSAPPMIFAGSVVLGQKPNFA